MNAIDFPGLFFLDTNLFVYSFDATNPDKQQLARAIIGEALHTRRGVVSTQVVQEFVSVALGKFKHPMSVADARDYVRTVMAPLCQHSPTIAFYDQTLLLREQTGLSWYDALIVAAAVELKCTLLLSEDMQDGRRLHGITIRNPFAAPTATMSRARQ